MIDQQIWLTYTEIAVETCRKEKESVLTPESPRARILADGGEPPLGAVVMLDSTWEQIKLGLAQVKEEEVRTLGSGHNVPSNGDSTRHNPALDEIAQSSPALACWRDALLSGQYACSDVWIYTPTRRPDRVCLGCEVEIWFLEEQSREKYRVGSSFDARVEAGVISSASPLGKAIMGGRKGETRAFLIGSRARSEPVNVTIVEIREVPALN